MQPTDVTTSTPPLDSILSLVFLLVIIFGAVWLVTSVIGYMHRRAYNLTRAESGGSGPIRPDFLNIDEKKRQAAMERRDAYEKVLTERKEAEEAPEQPAVKKLGKWSRIGALITAVFGLVAAIVGTITRVDQLQAGVEQMYSWDSFSELVRTYPVGTAVAVLVIGANVIAIAQKTSAKG